MKSIPYGAGALALPEIIYSERCSADFLSLTPGALAKQENKSRESEIISRALSSPVGRPPVSSFIDKNDKIAVVIPDITRRCPVKLILESLLPEISAVGADNILIIVALGNHRALSGDETASIVGRDIAGRYRIINHDSDGDCRYVGTTSRGNRVMINKHAVDADKVFITGTANYHSFAGFSGGRKSILPGVAKRETIMYNHKLCVMDTALDDACGPGILSGNPIHEDMEEALSLFGSEKLYMVNTVINIHGQVLGAYAGCPIKAFGEAVKHVRSLYSIDISGQYDIVITSPGGAPADINFYQSQKAIEMGWGCVKSGGDFFLAAACEDGVGEDMELFRKWLRLDDKGLLDMFKTDFHNLGFGPYKTNRLYEAGCYLYLVSDALEELEGTLKMERISPSGFGGALTRRINMYNLRGIAPKIAVIPYGSFTCLNRR